MPKETKVEEPSPENPIEFVISVISITAICSVTLCVICGLIGFKVWVISKNSTEVNSLIHIL